MVTGRLLPPDLTDRETIGAYRSRGGYRSSPVHLIAHLHAAGLRGRGGAAFPTGRKLAAVAERPGKKFVVCNGEEGEPGSLKDRFLMERRPHLVLEGTLLACRAVGAKKAYLYLSQGFAAATDSLTTALREAGDEGLTDGVEIAFFHVPHSYVAGEETAALQAIEGKPPKPRFKPPRPFEAGLFGQPTLIQNVETLAYLPLIALHGADWYREAGTAGSPGTALFSLGGDVTRPGVYELPFGVSLRALIESHGGGTPEGKPVRAVLPGGYFCGFLPAQHLDTPLTYEDLTAKRVSMGSATVTVIAEDGPFLPRAQEITNFFARETCRQCGPCVNGTGIMDRILGQFVKGKGKAEYLEQLDFFSRTLRRRGACAHLDGAALVMASLVREFRPDLERGVAG